MRNFTDEGKVYSSFAIDDIRNDGIFSIFDEFAVGADLGYSAIDAEISTAKFELIDGISVQGVAEGELLNADAAAGITSNVDDGYGFEAELLASGASGQIGGTLDIFGLKITVEATGRAGAVGGELKAKFGSKDEKIDLKIGGAFLFGGSIGISFDW